MKKAAEIHNLQVSFETKEQILTAVDSISFTLKPGETLALLGESGCGKSLTALALMRLLPRQAVYGSESVINLDATEVPDILNLPEYLMRQIRGRRLAIIFQDPMTALNPVLTIGAQLKEAVGSHHKLSHSALHAYLIYLLEEVEIPEPEMRLGQYPHQLSGGQKQRIIIAMALANKPEIIIADEPTTALDVSIQAQILRLLKKLEQEYQLSILLITHDLGVVKAAADRVAVMYAGQIVEEAPVAAFFQNPKHPYSQQLMASIPDFDKRGFPLQAIKGGVPVLDALPSGCRFHPRCAHAFQPCDTQVPVLQNFHGNQIRCHLYPERQALPALVHREKHWIEPDKERELLLSVIDLTVFFKAKCTGLLGKKKLIKAVDGLSLELYKGRTLALVGESGCGKTTASRAILRLIPKTSGDIYYKDENIDILKGSALRQYHKHVQCIFQDPYASMNPRLTVAEILAEGMVAQGMKRKVIESRQLELLNQVNLSKNSLTRYPYQFSGGQRQRICIARALAMNPEILVCDEPTSALDLSVQAQILNLLKVLQLEMGIAYLFITHNMAVVSYLADEVLVMRNGHALESGSTKQILQSPKHAYTRELLASVLRV